MKDKKSRLKKILWTVSGVLLAVLIAGGLWLDHFTKQGLAQIEGSLVLPGLAQETMVIRDENGVSYIEAQDERDLFMAQGFVHAQDRLFQMDLGRRQASGRLAELFGERAVEQDKFFRTLLLRYTAEASVAVQSPETLEILQWYADGVNAYREQALAQGNLSVEFQILGYEPEPWTVEDSLTFVMYQAYNLGGHWEGQAFRAYLMQNFEEEKAFELFPSSPKDGPYIISDEDLAIQGLFDEVILPDEQNGSNNWVVSGSRTASGMPMLADDPHLGLATPAIWYNNHLQGGRFNVTGVSVAGVPGIVLGHNDQIAWGVTNTGPDVQDLFIEKRNPENPYQFLVGDGWQDAKVLEETIEVDGAEPIPFEVVITRNGPIISELAGYEDQETALSLKWTAHEPSAELDAILGFNLATDWESFNAAGEKLVAPTQNFVFAAVDGTIAYKTIGQVPIRANDRLPNLPAPGWNEDGAWIGVIPYDEMPTVVNPVEGFISSANNKVVSDQYPYFITDQWAQPYRQMRIQEMLRDNQDLTAADMATMQGDVLNLEAAQFLPLMLEQLKGMEVSNRSEEALSYLREWDYEDEMDSVGSAIFNVWMREIQNTLFEEAIPENMMELFNRKSQYVNELLSRSFAGESVHWIDDNGGLDQVLLNSLAQAQMVLEEKLGARMAGWQWGKYHQVGFLHPLSSVTPLNLLFNPRGNLESPGSAVTVRAANFNQNGLNNHGAGWRFVIDMADTSTSQMIVAPGNSGHPRSPFYHNNIDRWIEGSLYETGPSSASGATLILIPEQR